MFVNAGLNKFFNYMPMPENMPEEQLEIMGAFVQIAWLMPLIAITEIAGGILFAIPRYRPLGAIIILPVVVGIVLHHFIHAPEGLPIAIALLAVNAWAIAENWKKYLPMIQKP